MLLTSPLGVLHNVLQSVCASANVNAPLLRKNEAATRAALIDPVLRALGWDTTNVQMVEPERTVGAKQTLDYVLHGAAGNIAAVVEAKKLDESLDKLGHIGAAIGYAFSLKPNKLFITDGIHWHFYSPDHSSYHPVETISLTETPLVKAALLLIQWLDSAQSGLGINLASNEKQTASTLAFAKPQKHISRQTEKASQKLSNFVELTHINTLQLELNQKPKQLRLPDGTVKSMAVV